jgi:D-2-hydroxyacid dehydrogenase (NADP+)
MKSLNVLMVNFVFDKSMPPPDSRIRRRIAAVSPAIRIKEMTITPGHPPRETPAGKETVDELLAWAEVMYGFVPPGDIVSRAPNLKWFQTISAGVDRHLGTEIWNSPVTITGVSGIHATPIGEFVLGLMLMFAKRSHLSLRQQLKHEWRRFMPAVLRGKTVGIVGLGNIGREVARLARAFGMKVIANRRSAKKPGHARHVDTLLPAAQLKLLLKESDYVVVATPLTPQTRHLIGRAELAAMKPTAVIINIARGGVIDPDALTEALQNGRIAGAGLDVTSPEPLPPDSPLWDMENVILSPHISGGMEDYLGQATDLFCENLRRYLEGDKLINVIDKAKGY